jgi:serine-type D-Ala-D-Ala carboxypeptidase (penicillin-binding protein 5/6)
MRLRLVLGLALVLLGCRAVQPAQAVETAARAAIILDNRTGVVLFEKNADERMPPASMSKLMTAYMIFDQLKGGRLKLDDEVLVSERAWKMGGSQMFVKVGDRVKVEDLIRGIIIQSGNDACVTMAEAIAGSEEEFARQMTDKAKEIGLTNSTFANATGLDAPDHLMSVRDLALLARRIIADFPEYFKYYSEREFEYGGIRQPNRNPLLQAGVPGVDGMKTGFTDGSGYGLVATAKRDDRRVITVMAGLQSAGQRRTEGDRLLEYGFREFQEYRLFAPGVPVAEVDVWQGVAPKVPLVVTETVGVTLSREARKGLVARLSYPSPLPAPILAGQEVGHAEITAPGMAPVSVPLVTGNDVARAGVLARTTGSLSYLIWGAPAG